MARPRDSSRNCDFVALDPGSIARGGQESL